MAILKNTIHEKYCQGIASGLKAGEAYQIACPNAKNNSARTLANRLSKVDAVRARIEELKLQNDNKSCITRQELIEGLSDIFRSKQPDVKVSDKIKASERLCRMLGWDEPEEHTISGDLSIIDPVSILLQQIHQVRAQSKLDKPGETNTDPP